MCADVVADERRAGEREPLADTTGVVSLRWRWTVFAVLAAVFFTIALSDDVYNLTSPPALSWHVLLRKSYSIVAFALVGASFVWASGATLLRSAIVVACYSGAIEVGQHYVNAWKPIADQEPLFWNAIDVLCGALGGALGGLMPWVRAREAASTSAVRKRDRIPRA